MGPRTNSESARERPEIGDLGSTMDESETESSLSSADLQAATKCECLRHAAFFTILSSDGPRRRPAREGPPRVWEADIDLGSRR